MFTIGLSGRRIIKRYPAMQRELDEISIHDSWMQHRKWTSEPIGEPRPFGQVVGGAGLSLHDQPMVTQLRPLFHAMLYHQIERFGIEVSYGKRIVKYYEDAERGVGGVVTENGEHAEADLVLAADGLNSHSQELVFGGQNKGKPSGRSIFRAAWDLDLAMADPVVKETFGLKDGRNPLMQAWMGPDTHAMTLSYVDKHGKNGQMLWGITFNEPGEQDTTESWRNTVSGEDVLKMMDKSTPGWGEPMKRLVRTMPAGSIIFWPLLWRDPNPRTHSPGARVLQIGDAAHSFLPTSGNGATQAIEDGITIATCLQHAGIDDVATAVKTHSLLRSDRVSCGQLLGFVNAERFQKTDLSKVGSDAKKVAAKVPKWLWQLDPEQYAEEQYAAAAASLQQGGSAFVNTNIPTGYTPTPWTLADIEKLESEGKHVELVGDWS
ncbi:hypothetical protein LTR85_003237 [Meristemomyces frigidus]|nr:hypothetical protein LTR85_003237 [Meristemomyces frigidus]